MTETDGLVRQVIAEHLESKGMELIGEPAWDSKTKQWLALVNAGALLLMAFTLRVEGTT